MSIRPERFGALLYHFGTRTLSFLKSRTLLDVVERLDDSVSAREACVRAGVTEAELRDLPSRAAHPRGLADDRREDRRLMTALPLVDQFQYGLDAPICLTWELTYACNLSCVHCLSSSGRRDPRELTTDECKAVIDELERMQVFYVNIGGGEPTVRPDFWELVDYATAHHVGVKFSTNGVKITPEVARRLAASDYVDVQISLDGATAEVNDVVRGPGSYDTALRAMRNLHEAGFRGFKISVVMTRENVGQLDDFKAIADRYDAQLRITRLRPSGRGADVWDELHVTADAAARAVRLARRERRERPHRRLVLPSRRVRRRAARPEPLRRGTGRVPHRPGRRRVRLPVRHPRELPGRQCAQRRRIRRRVARVGAVRRAARAADRRRLHVVLGVRLVPRRLHGGEVLHRPATRRPRPGVREGPRRARAAAGRVRLGAEAVPRPLAPQGRGQHRHAGRTARATRIPLPDWTLQLAELSWPDVARRAADGAVLAVPLGSTEQHGPHLPLSTDTDVAVALAVRLAAGARRRARRALRAVRILR